MKIQIDYLDNKNIIRASIPVRTIKEARLRILQIKNSNLYNGKKVIGKPLIT